MTAIRDLARPQDALALIDERIEADLGTRSTHAASAATRLASGIVSPLARLSGSGAAAYDANYAYAELGDHWQEGRTWPIAYPDAIRTDRLAEIRPMFCSVGMIEDGIGRQNDALFGREPTIKAEPLEPAGTDGEPSDAQAREGAEAMDRLANWWDAVGLWEHVKSAGGRAAWAKRGPLRIRYLPGALVTPPGAPEGTAPKLVTGKAGEAALALIALSAELPRDALLYTDPDTQEKACIIRIAEKDAQGGTLREAAEVWYADGDTVIRKILHADGAASEYPVEGGALPLHEITGQLLVTQPVREQQAAIDFKNTLSSRILQASAHRDHYTVGAEDPGEWSTVPTAPGVPLKTATDAAGNTIYFHPGEWAVGPGTISMIQPRVITDAEGNEEALPVQVGYVDPADPAFATNALNAAIAVLRVEMKQGHAGYGDKAVSGEKVKQDRADFGKRCDSYRQSAELAIAGVLMAAARNASLLTTEGDWLRSFVDNFRIVVTLHIDTGPLTAEEIKEQMELADRGYKPRPDVMAAVAGVEDFAAADAAIRADPEQRMRLRKIALEEAELIANTFSAPAAVEALRDTGLFSDAELAAMVRTDFVTGGQ